MQEFKGHNGSCIKYIIMIKASYEKLTLKANLSKICAIQFSALKHLLFYYSSCTLNTNRKWRLSAIKVKVAPIEMCCSCKAQVLLLLDKESRSKYQ